MLITGLGWEGGLVIENRQAGDQKNKQSIAPGSELSWALSAERSCIGYRPPGGESLVPCPQEATGISGYQCPQCLEAAMNLPCLRCVGDYCRNPARRAQCVAPRNHALYLAAFSDQIIKVGVARWTRRHQRIAEQGARAGIIIARDDGQMIRRHEAQIKSLGFPDRLSTNGKLAALSAWPEENLDDLLEAARQSLHRRMRAPWIEPERADIPEQPLLPRPRLLDPAGVHLSGRVVANWGQIIVVSDVDNDLVAVDGQTLVGRRVQSLPAGSAANYQRSLFPQGV
jgi:hypothetical protein